MREFSNVLQLLPKKFNHLDIAKKGNLRLLMIDIKHQIKLLVVENQAQASH